MLSSQQRLLIRAAARRRLPLVNKQRYNSNGSLPVAGFTTLPSFPGNSSRRDEKTTNSNLNGLPGFSNKNPLLRSTLLDRAYPMGISMSVVGTKSPMFWFSSTTRTNNKETGVRERASEYGERARHGAQSFGGMMKRYGPTFVGTYLSVYAANLGLFYLGIASGALDPVTMIGYVTGNHEEVRNTAEVVSELLEHYTITAPFAETVQDKPHLANFAVAWISTKFTEPIRMGLSIAIVPTVARYLGTVRKTEEEKVMEEKEGEAEKEEKEGESKTEEKKP